MIKIQIDPQIFRSNEWRQMDSAPRDGSVITGLAELDGSDGVVPQMSWTDGRWCSSISRLPVNPYLWTDDVFQKFDETGAALAPTQARDK